MCGSEEMTESAYAGRKRNFFVFRTSVAWKFELELGSSRVDVQTRKVDH